MSEFENAVEVFIQQRSPLPDEFDGRAKARGSAGTEAGVPDARTRIPSPLATAVTVAGKPCGLFFQARGPRQVKSYAVWSDKERRILFYDAAGVRFAETKLRKGPGLKEVAA
jgi:hypothetical protein